MRWFATIAAMMIAGQAAALSCIPPDIARTFQQLDAADERYAVVKGRLTFDERLVPKVDWNKQDQTPPLTQIPARLEGMSLSKTGFKTSFRQRVMINGRCFGPWCFGASSGMEQVFFVNLDGEPATIELDPCGGHAFAPDRATQKRVLSCLKGTACEIEKHR